jgi:hypothetical protein
MKKFLFIICLLVMVAMEVYAATAVAGDSYLTFPDNLVVKKLGTCNGSSSDTIAASGANVYGPYNVCKDNSRGMFKAFQLYAAEACIATDDSLRFDYQLIYGTSIADSVESGWTTVDTICDDAGEVGTYTSIDSKAANAILFRLYNIDADAAGIVAPVRVLFKEDMQAQSNTR